MTCGRLKSSQPHFHKRENSVCRRLHGLKVKAVHRILFPAERNISITDQKGCLMKPSFQMSLYMRLYLGTLRGSIGLVTISFPLKAPLRITSTRSMKSCLVLKLPINLVWSGVLNKKQKRWIVL